MRSRFYFVWLAAIAAALMFTMAACVSGNGGGNVNDDDYVDNYTYDTSPSETAAELVSKMRVGWNLGNTFDAAHLTWLGSNPSVTQMETGWVNHVTAKANITAVRNAGFNTIRIPVSWHKAADSNYNIRADWMRRVTEVVNYAVDNEMFIILNTHHDEDIFKFTDANVEESLKAFKKIWEQIAVNFKDYDEKLIFEALNEPRTKGSQAEWNGGTAEERGNLNRHYQVFVDAVRASGGNNDKRILMLNTYAASGVAVAMNDLAIPNDTAENRIIVSYHAYEPYNFALNEKSPVKTWDKNNSSDTSPIKERVDRAYNIFVSKGIPVVVGEFGALNKNNEDVRGEWAEYYVSYAKSREIKCVWWDDGGHFIIYDRKVDSFRYPKIRDGLMKGSR